MEELLKQILGKVGEMQSEIRDIKTNMATKDDISRIEKKLDIVMEQVARNTEEDTAHSEVAAAVETHAHGLDVLNRKVFKLESEVSRLLAR